MYACLLCVYYYDAFSFLSLRGPAELASINCTLWGPGCYKLANFGDASCPQTNKEWLYRLGRRRLILWCGSPRARFLSGTIFFALIGDWATQKKDIPSSAGTILRGWELFSNFSCSKNRAVRLFYLINGGRHTHGSWVRIKF